MATRKNSNEVNLVPEGRPNHYVDAVALGRGETHVYVLREGQTPEEFWSELDAAKVREQYGLAPGRTMPTEAEIAQGPVGPGVDRLTQLEARLNELEAKAEIAKV